MERLQTVDRLIKRMIRLAVVAAVVVFWWVVAAAPELPGPSGSPRWIAVVAICTSATLLLGGAWPRDHR